MLRVYEIIILLMILTILCAIFVKYVWDTNVGLFVFLIEVSFLILLFIIDTITLALYKEWEVKEARFGLMGTLVRAFVGMAVIFGVIYIIVQYLPLPS
jgi:hypothetical protein